MQTNKRIIRINASSLKNATCLLRFYRTVIEGYKSSINSNKIEFGSAGHLFLSQMARTKGDLAVSMNAAREYFRTTPMIVMKDAEHLNDMKLCGTCVEFWTWLQANDTFKILEVDGEPAVEVTFDNKVYEDEQFEVRLQGTIDKLGQFERGCFAIGDYKFSNSWGMSYDDKKKRQQLFFKTHELGVQLRFYHYNLLLKAKAEPDGVLAEVCKRQVGCFIDAIFHSKKDATEFKRSPIYFFTSQDVDEFEKMLMGFIATLIQVLRLGIEPPRHGILNGACGGGFHLCDFFNVCSAPSDVARAHILKNDFVQREYLPIKERE